MVSHWQFWENMLTRLTVLDFDRQAARKADELVSQ
jgi:hypothetical protein